MPPPRGVPLNPVDNPAFSPPPTADPSLRAPNKPINNIATNTINPLTLATHIPSKFLATSQSPSGNTVPRPVRTANDVDKITKGEINTATQPTATLRGGTSQTPATGLCLPELPNWIMHVFVVATSFMLIVAFVLLLAQFPPNLKWLQRWKRRTYEKLSQDEHESDESDELFFAESSAVALNRENNDTGQRISSDSLRRRRPTNLSVDTSLARRGLAIAVRGNDFELKTLQKRRSYDEQTLRMQAQSPARAGWDSFTAPLRSAPMFSGGKKQTDPATGYNVETGLSALPFTQVSTADIFDVRSEYHNDDDIERKGGALLKKVNGGIYHVADRLSRTFYDQFSEPEEGLLLPVRDGDRERPMAPGVFFD